MRETTDTRFFQPRFRWRQRLPVLAVLASIVAVALAGASVAATAAQASSRQRLCSGVVSLGAIRSASRLAGMKQYGKVFRWSKRTDGFWTQTLRGGPGSLPGSLCEYDDPTPNTSYTQQEFGMADVLDAFVAVGYGESQRNWRRLSKSLAANGGQGEGSEIDIPNGAMHGNSPETRLTLGHGSKSFLNTGNLVAAQDADPTADPQFPSHFYVVTVLTRHHNVLQIGMYGATLAATKATVIQVLKSNTL
jgi:hypothetical protein